MAFALTAPSKQDIAPTKSAEGTPKTTRMCIASKLDRNRAETFIRTHMELLPFDVRVLSGVPPIHDERDGCVLQKSFKQRLLDRFSRPSEHEQTVAAQVEYLRRSGIELVLAEYGTVGAEMAEPCRRAGVPLVVHFHGNDAHNHQTRNEWREPYAAMFQYAAALVAVSGDMRRQLESLGAPAHKIALIPYWVDPERFCDASPAAAPPHLLAVGRFVEKKAPHLTVLAFERVARLVPEARLVMIGSGPLWGACRHLATVLGVSDRIDFLGPQPPAEVAAWMRKVRGFAQHSVIASDGDCEGTPVAILEAAASGLPVVATRHTGIKEAVLDAQTGLLVDELDVDGMAEAMRKILEAPDLAGELGAAARLHVAARYGREQTLDRLGQLLTQVVEDKLPASAE